MLNSKLLIIGFACTLTLSLNAEAKLYKWVDNNGTTHYGEVIPPEYANKERDTLNKSGTVEKRVEKKVTVKEVESPEEIEQKRRNSALLNTYSNEHEIDLARERSLVLINARIESNKMLLKSSQNSLDDLNKEVEARTKAGKKIPTSLTKDIQQTKERVGRYSTELDKSEADLVSVGTHFDEEKANYRKLKGSN